MKTYAYILLLLLIMVVKVNGEEEIRARKFFPDLIYCLPLDLALPDNFEVDSPMPGNPPSLYEGVIWGERETIDQYWKMYRGEQVNIDKGVFLVRLSPNIDQKTVFSESDENELLKELEGSGMYEIKTTNKMWENYPVVAYEGFFPNAQPFSMAFLGMNYAGQVLEFVYFYPKDPNRFQDAHHIWKTFIEETKILESGDYLKCLGMDLKPGKTQFTRAKATVQLTSEKTPDNKVTILLEPVTDETRVEFYKLSEDQKDDIIDVEVKMDSSVEGLNVHGYEKLPAWPKNVEKTTLVGEKVYEDGNVIILKKKNC